MKDVYKKSLNPANFHTANLILLLATKAMNGPKLTSTLTNLTGIFSTAVFFTPTSFEFHAVSLYVTVQRKTVLSDVMEEYQHS